MLLIWIISFKNQYINDLIRNVNCEKSKIYSRNNLKIFNLSLSPRFYCQQNFSYKFLAFLGRDKP